MRIASILLISFVALVARVSDGDSRQLPSRNPFSKDSWRTQSPLRKCAHMVILDLSGSDPKIVKPTSERFRSTMPVLLVPPPCAEDSARSHQVAQNLHITH